MSAAARTEKGFLKLVYPKGRIELHKHPITAAEVLERNPRCCVTRPDVFKYPWIVVSPESVLPLNRVFYVVPLRTIHHLLKEHGVSPSKQIRLRQQQQEEEALQQVLQNEHTLVQNPAVSRQLILSRRKTCRCAESLDGSNSESESSEICLSKNRSLVKHCCKPLTEPAGFHRLVRGQNVVSSQKNDNQEPSDGDKKCESRTRTAKIQFNDQEKHKEPHIKQYPVEHRSKSHAIRKYQQQDLEHYDSGCMPFRRNKDLLADAKCVDRLTKLKPCLKSNQSNSPRSLSHLSVSFNIPDDDDKNGNQKLVIYKKDLDSFK